MNVFRFELRRLRNSTIGWIVGLIVLASVYLSVYPAFLNDLEVISQVYAGVPAGVQNALGLNNFDFETEFSFLRFYATIFSFILLAGGIQGMTVGLGLLSREQRATTSEFLFTKPVSRPRLYRAKLAAGWLLLSLTNLVFTGSIYLVARAVGAGDFDLGRFLMIHAVLLYVQLWFLGIGFLSATLLQRVKSVPATSLTVVFGLFLVGMLGTAIGEDIVRYVSPFKAINLSQIAANATVEWSYLAVSLGLLLVSLMVSYLRYTRRDVPASR